MEEESARQAEIGKTRQEDNKNFIMMRSSRNCAQNIAKRYSFATKKAERRAFSKGH